MMLSKDDRTMIVDVLAEVPSGMIFIACHHQLSWLMHGGSEFSVLRMRLCWLGLTKSIFAVIAERVSGASLLCWPELYLSIFAGFAG